MRIRREQALLLAVVVVGVWLALPDADRSRPVPPLSVTQKAYEAAPVPGVELFEGKGAGARPADLFLEPSESQPLPPAILPFPPLGALPVVALPMAPGQHGDAYWQLRVPGDIPAEPIPLTPAGPGAETRPASGAAGSAAGAGAPAAANAAALGGDSGASAQDAARARYERLYDRLTLNDGLAYWGEVLNKNKHRLALQRTFQEPIEFRWISEETGAQIGKVQSFAPDKVARVELAKTLRNQIERTKLELKEDVASLPQRAEFLEQLLREARTETWVYAEALAQAQLYARLRGDSEDGLRWVARVLREQGDIAKELALYQGLSGASAESGFRHAGLGSVKARLGLVRDAEADLRKAVALEPANPRVAMALVAFLLEQERAGEAIEPLDAAVRNRGMLAGPAEQYELGTLAVSVHLALGRVDAARQALSRLETDADFQGQRDLLRACIAYAERKVDDAAAAYRDAAGTTALGGALGVGACQILKGQWSEARSMFETVRDLVPALRHRAHAGLALLYERTGHIAEAITEAEAAVACNPRDAYALYLLGRLRRLSGQFDSAVEALGRALQVRDRMLDAYAEMAMAELQLATQQPDTAADHLVRATRYVDRLVELQEPHGQVPLFLDLQGRIRFAAGDLRGARQAFARAGDKSTFAQVGIALVDYAQDRQQEARGQLEAIARRLKRGEAMREFCEEIVRRIDDHADQEQIRDPFERDALGNVWQRESTNGPLWAELVRGAASVRGTFTQANKPVVLRRSPSPQGRNFVSAEVMVRVEGETQERFFGLRLQEASARAGRGGSDFDARLGWREGKPYLLIQDGDPTLAQTEEDKKRFDPVELALEGVDPKKPQILAFEVLPREQGGGNLLALRAYWNGKLVHERPVQRITRNSRTILHIDLMVEAPAQGAVDASFDDYRLVRRKEKS
ncbi:MAG: hypothetical protein IT458_01215 [Planctomycetes bacterium]|nr:hypothetical protein [Planctomycetota bacterium]